MYYYIDNEIVETKDIQELCYEAFSWWRAETNPEVKSLEGHTGILKCK
jgi:hypothetical protein